MTIERRFYRFESLIDTKEICSCPDVLRVAISEFEKKYYMYIETKSKESNVFNLLNEENRIYEIFHFFPSQEASEWIKDRKNPTKAVILFTRLKPEMISSYIYHHFALQEELDGERFKYYSIFIHGNLLINFAESPSVVKDPHIPASLKSSISKRDDWNEYMRDHLMPGERWNKGTIHLDFTAGQEE